MRAKVPPIDFSETDKQQFRTRIPTLFEIFYGLALASGIEQVAPRLFGYDGGTEVESWSFATCAVITVLIGIGDWIAYYLHEDRYKGPFRLVVDLIYVALIFCLFATAHSLPVFLVLIVIYCWLAVLYPKLREWDTGNKKVYDSMPFRVFRAVVITVACALVFVNVSFLSKPYTDIAAVACVGIFTGWSWLYLLKQLRAILKT